MTSPDDSLPAAGTVVLLRDAEPGLQVLLIRRPDRGSFASAWVFPGGRVEPGDRHPGEAEGDAARRAGIRETFEEVGLVVDDVQPLSEWHPPVEAPTRIRTWFFIGRGPEQELVPSADEVADVVWVSPSEALERHAAGEWVLFPPTWVTLHQLTVFEDADSALSSGGAGQLFQTRVLDEGRTFSWTQGRLEAGALPWRFEPA